MASHISLGQLAVTYRPVTFLDQNGDHSARVNNIYGIGTPTVYDLVNDEVLDINDDNWLSKLVSTV